MRDAYYNSKKKDDTMGYFSLLGEDNVVKCIELKKK